MNNYSKILLIAIFLGTVSAQIVKQDSTTQATIINALNKCCC
jgi:hypothetical protein